MSEHRTHALKRSTWPREPVLAPATLTSFSKSTLCDLVWLLAARDREIGPGATHGRFEDVCALLSGLAEAVGATARERRILERLSRGRRPATAGQGSG